MPAQLTVLEDGGTYDYYQGYYYVDTATGTITGASIQQDNAGGPAQQPAQPAQAALGSTAYWLADSGQWYVHGLQLQITQGSSGLYGTMTWNAGGNIWTGTAHLVFALQPDGSLVGTFTDSAAYTQAGQSNPDGLQPDPGGPQQGQVITLVPVAPMHASVVLGSNSPMMLSGGNLNLCQQGLPDASQYCGA